VADAFALEMPHVVGADVGTAASLFVAASRQGRFRSLIVGSGCTAFPLRLGGVLKDWVDAPELEAYHRADPRQIVAGALTDNERYTVPDYVREDYLSSYAGERAFGLAICCRRDHVSIDLINIAFTSRSDKTKEYSQ
jgi:hypothetical protein